MTGANGTWRISGHEHAVKLLAGSLTSPAHAYLFLGPKSIGKRTLALELAKALNCEASEGERPCQGCSSCRLIGSGGHPDVSVLEPDEKEHVSVDQVRELRRQLALFPGQGRWRVVIVRADWLTENAADAFLKTLEEPNPQVVLILTGHDLESIPETIVSRCRCVVLDFVPVDAVVQELRARGADQATAERLSGLCYGAAGWAIDAFKDGRLADRRATLRDDLARWASGSLLERLQAADNLSGGTGRKDTIRSTVIEELEVMTSWWRDILFAASGQPGLIVNGAASAEIEALAARESLESALSTLRAILKTATRINQNVDPRLALEALAVGL